MQKALQQRRSVFAETEHIMEFRFWQSWMPACSIFHTDRSSQIGEKKNSVSLHTVYGHFVVFLKNILTLRSFKYLHRDVK